MLRNISCNYSFWPAGGGAEPRVRRRLQTHHSLAIKRVSNPTLRRPWGYKDEFLVADLKQFSGPVEKSRLAVKSSGFCGDHSGTLRDVCGQLWMWRKTSLERMCVNLCKSPSVFLEKTLKGALFPTAHLIRSSQQLRDYPHFAEKAVVWRSHRGLTGVEPCLTQKPEPLSEGTLTSGEKICTVLSSRRKNQAHLLLNTGRLICM